MIADLAAKHAFSQAIVDGVSERTGGVPLFIEEVTRLLLERGEQSGAQAIPPTLQQSLTARLDRLGTAREVAMIGAVLGRGFSYALLRAIAGMDEAPLQQALERLAEADILLVEGLPPEAEYRFKHALIQDAAYENLLKSRRQALHQRAAETLREQFPERAAAQPEVLARHFTEAGLAEAAIDWWGRAGDQALRRSAFQEAIAHLGKAIEMADNGAGGTQGEAGAIVAAGLRLKLQTSYGQAMAYSRGYAAEETKAAFERAEQLAGGIDNSAQRFKTYLGRWTALVVGGEFAKARDTVEIYRREATEQGRLPDIARASHCLGATCMWQGELSGARAHLEEALSIYVSEADKDGKRGHGLDFKAAGTAKLANVCWQLGELERARELFDTAIARAVETGHSPTIADAHGHKMMAETARGMVAAAQRDADIVTEIAGKTGLAYYLAGGRLSQAWARARLGDHDAGVAELRQALATSVELGARSPHAALSGPPRRA